MTNINTTSGAAEREKFIQWHMENLHSSEMMAALVWDNGHFLALCWRAALASAAAPAEQGVQWQCGPQANGFTAPQADSVLDGAVLLKEARDALWQPANVALCERIDAYLDAASKQGANHD